MAQAPNAKEVVEAQEKTIKAIEKKTLSQQKQGKDFIVPEDGHGPGIIPEAKWKAIKQEPQS